MCRGWRRKEPTTQVLEDLRGGIKAPTCRAGGAGSVVYWLRPSKPKGYSPVAKLSTGCGAEQRRNNTNPWITGRGARQNAGSNANAMLIHSKTQDDHKTFTHISPKARSKTCTITTPDRHHALTRTRRATVSRTGL